MVLRLISLIITVLIVSGGQESKRAPVILEPTAAFVQWSIRTGLETQNIREMWLIASGSDAERDPTLRLVNFERGSRGNTFLLVASHGNGECLSAHVFMRKQGAYQQAWEVSEAPDGAGFCRERGNMAPSAFWSSEGDVVLAIPIHDQRSRTGGIRFYRYRRAIDSYSFLERWSVYDKQIR